MINYLEIFDQDPLSSNRWMDVALVSMILHYCIAIFTYSAVLKSSPTNASGP